MRALTVTVLVLALVPASATAQQHVYPDCAYIPCGPDIACPPDVQVEVTFDRVYEGNYNNGQPYDYVTISPGGNGETFADMGIRIRFRITCPTTGWPITQIPAGEMLLFSNTLCLCTIPTAAYATDADGWSEFSGTIAGGGCAQGLDFYFDGMYMASIPVNINSTDAVVATPCATDAGDIGVLATKLGNPAAWDICSDFNESGPPIDAGDIAFLASMLGSACP
jgi:hypothetical protein